MHIKRPTPSRGTEPPDLAVRASRRRGSTLVAAIANRPRMLSLQRPARVCKAYQRSRLAKLEASRQRRQTGAIGECEAEGGRRASLPMQEGEMRDPPSPRARDKKASLRDGELCGN